MSLDKIEARERAAAALAKLPDFAAGHWTSADGLEMALGYATKTRTDLAMREVPDLALANALYLASGEIVIQTAAKERMRWLSVQLVLTEARAVAAEAELVAAKADAELCAASWSKEIEANNLLRAELKRRDEAVSALEPFARLGMPTEDTAHLPDELVISLTYDDTKFDAELGGPNTLLGEPFYRAFRRAAAALAAIEQNGADDAV